MKFQRSKLNWYCKHKNSHLNASVKNERTRKISFFFSNRRRFICGKYLSNPNN